MVEPLEKFPERSRRPNCRMNRLRSFAVLLFIASPFVGRAHAETEAQMRARAAAEISRQATAALGHAAAPILRSELDLMESLKWRRAALAAIDKHAAKLPLIEETWPAVAPKDQQTAALLAGRAWPKTAR